MTAKIDYLRKNYKQAKDRAERALQERDRAFYWLRDAEIAEQGCKISGFTINACSTCGRDESEAASCPHWPKEQSS